MKKYICIVLHLIFMISLSAQKISHPSLIFTPEKIEQVKKTVKQDSAMAADWRQIKETADDNLQKNDLMRSDYLALAYQFTGEKKYAEKLKSLLINAIKAESWGNSEMILRTPAWNSELQMAHRSFACALAYDAIYNDLTVAERKDIAQGLKRLAITPALNDWLLEPTRIHSLNSMGHNWWTSCVCMGGLLALALQDELPEASEWVATINEILPEWFDFAGDVLQQKAKSFDRNGGMYESINYANFGIQEALLFRLAWLNTHKGQKAPEIPQLSQLPDFFTHVCYPRTGILYSINFGDSHKNITAESTLLLLYAQGIQSENMLWYFRQVRNEQHRDGYFRSRPMGFLYYPDMKQAPEIPNLKKSQLFPDFGWATMRNSWKKDATMLAIKCGHTWNHSHADANSFILFHKGIDIIKDAGNCSYPRPEYRNYFFQSNAHNVVLFNGKGQSAEQQYHGSSLRGYLYHLLDADNIKYILANGTGPASDNFSRNYRHFLWIDNIIYIIDDLKTHKNGHFEWLWHPGGAARKTGIDLNISNDEAAVAIRPLYPRMLAKSDFVHDYPEDLYWEELKGATEDLRDTEIYFSFHLPAEVNRIKAVNAIILKDTPAQKELPKIERREGKDWIGLRVTDKGKITDIYINQLADGRLMHLNSWIYADDWETDAYMFAVSYPENTKPTDSKEIFCAYGSALRNNTTTHFSSLSKLFFIKKENGGSTQIWMDGQPKIHAFFKVDKKPSDLKINEISVPINYKNSQIEIKVTN